MVSGTQGPTVSVCEDEVVRGGSGPKGINDLYLGAWGFMEHFMVYGPQGSDLGPTWDLSPEPESRL